MPDPAPSVLEAIQAHWSTKTELTGIVPAERVFLGPPNPGAALPCLGLVAEQIADGLQTSSRRYPQITIQAVAQAQDLATLEALRESMRDHLDGWTSQRYGPMQLASLQMTIQRPETSPSRCWIAEAAIQFDAMTL